MKKYLYLFIAALFLFSTARDGNATTVFAGGEADSDGQSYFLLSGASAGERFLEVSIEAHDYDLDDNGVDREASVRQVTIAGGMKIGGPMNLTVTAGPTIRKKETETSFGTSDESDIGITVGASGHKSLEGEAPVDEVEFSVSFSTLDSFLRGRVRGKTVRYVPYSVGAEAFIEVNNDYNAIGAGPFAEFQIDIGKLIVRAGLKHSSTTDSSVYGGFEFTKNF